MGKVVIQKKEYKGWKNCIEISNGIIDVIATTDVGPRIIRFGFAGKQNLFCEVKDQVGTTGGEEWKIYGGHRLWHSPENNPRTYVPDNSPIDYVIKENGVLLIQPTEHWTNIHKEIELIMVEDEAKVKVLHRLTNKGPWDIELSVWVLSVMAAGGKQIMPQVQKDTVLLPNRMISLWPYTKLNDPRVYWGEKYITLKQDTNAEQPFKIGFPNEDGWAAYINNSCMFVKKFDHKVGYKYPDYASSYETYTNHYMMEMESLSPLTVLAPGKAIEHTETWMLFDNVKVPESEAQIDETILPLIRQV